tara:strand:- start:213 stop:617 length:405 start_codon:yes stop_codon:yes gene_type:complete
MKFLLPKEIKDFFYRKQPVEYSEKERLYNTIRRLEQSIGDLNRGLKILDFELRFPIKYKIGDKVGKYIITAPLKNEYLKFHLQGFQTQVDFKNEKHCRSIRLYKCLNTWTNTHEDLSEYELLKIEKEGHDNNRN